MVQNSLAVFAAAAAKAIRSPAAKKAAVELTAAAATRIRELLGARHKVISHPQVPATASHQPYVSEYAHHSVHASQEYIKLGVKKRGCSGLSYTLNYSGKWFCYMFSTCMKASRLVVSLCSCFSWWDFAAVNCC